MSKLKKKKKFDGGFLKNRNFIWTIEVQFFSYYTLNKEKQHEIYQPKVDFKPLKTRSKRWARLKKRFVSKNKQIFLETN